ncbi:MAG: T9SS type A sorting domain-containing protein [Flavobacteriales bacterium]|nr:T9SS type A sorting domain-containing protein [Flavobacteriales bacterium]
MKILSTFITLCLLVPMIGAAQSQSPEPGLFEKKSAKPALSSEQEENRETQAFTNVSRGAHIWGEDFDGATNVGDSIMTSNGAWGKSGSNGNIWKYSETQSNGCWSFNTDIPNFSSADNGFLLFDADSANCQDADATPDPIFTSTIYQGSVVSPIIDLSSDPSVILSFEHQSRWCCNVASLTVEVSGDGGATWPTSFQVESSTIVNGQFEGVFEENVSAVMGGSAQAMFRLTWDQASHYFWVVDDFEIRAAQENDVLLNYAVVSHNNSFEEYGRIPKVQLQPQITLSAEIFNFGALTQTNVKLKFEVKNSNGDVILQDSSSVAAMPTLDTVLFEVMPDLPASMEFGVYTIDYTVTSDGDSVSGPFGSNNVLQRNFEVTLDRFSIDAIGNHPSSEQELDDITTADFAGGEDGLMVLTYYDVIEDAVAIGVEVLFSNATDDGGSVIVALHDSLSILVTGDVLSPLAQSDLLELLNIGSAPIYFPFEDEYEVVSGGYYVGVEMFSNINEFDIGILDDITVPQPGYSSLIYIADDQIYGNGNACAVRLVTAEGVGINELEETGIIFGLKNNPASEQLGYTISAEKNTTLNMVVTNIKGQIVYSEIVKTNYGLVVGSVNTSLLANGVYSIQLQGEHSSYTKKFIVTH